MMWKLFVICMCVFMSGGGGSELTCPSWDGRLQIGSSYASLTIPSGAVGGFLRNRRVLIAKHCGNKTRNVEGECRKKFGRWIVEWRHESEQSFALINCDRERVLVQQGPCHWSLNVTQLASDLEDHRQLQVASTTPPKRHIPSWAIFLIVCVVVLWSSAINECARLKRLEVLRNGLLLMEEGGAEGTRLGRSPSQGDLVSTQVIKLDSNLRYLAIDTTGDQYVNAFIQLAGEEPKEDEKETLRLDSTVSDFGEERATPVQLINIPVDLGRRPSRPSTLHDMANDMSLSALRRVSRLPIPSMRRESVSLSAKDKAESSMPSRTVSGMGCCICFTPSRQVALLPCKHWCVCKNCCLELKQTSNASPKCPICRATVGAAMIVEEEEEGSEGGKKRPCLMCKNKKKECVVLPCRHWCVCFECALVISGCELIKKESENKTQDGDTSKEADDYAVKIVKPRGNCPICKEAVIGSLQLHSG